jgi:hypothetical protein
MIVERLSSLSESGLMILPTINDLMWRDLLSWRDTCFGYLSLSTKAVVAGVAAEAPELLWEIIAIITRWKFRRRFHFSLPEDHAPSWVKVVAFVGWILIVGGVAGEWYSEIKLGDADASIESFITAISQKHRKRLHGPSNSPALMN